MPFDAVYFSVAYNFSYYVEKNKLSLLQMKVYI